MRDDMIAAERGRTHRPIVDMKKRPQATTHHTPTWKRESVPSWSVGTESMTSTTSSRPKNVVNAKKSMSLVRGTDAQQQDVDGGRKRRKPGLARFAFCR